MRITHIPRNRDLHKRRVAAYCRVSTLLEEQEDSFEFQQTYYTNFILSHEDWEFAGIYSDEKSGTKADNREGFKLLIKDALEAKIDYILCKSVSRFSRNMVDCKKFIKLLQGNGINVYFEKENMDTADPSCSMMFSFLSTISQDESRSISENVKWGYRERFKSGEYNLGNNRVLGYDSVNGKLIPNQSAEVIRLIFQLFLEKKEAGDIAERLEAIGFLGRNGKPLTRDGILYILGNETYVGDKLLQKRAPKNFLSKQPERGITFESKYLVDDHEAIIDRETWDKVQVLLKTRKEELEAGTKQSKRTHFLYGKVFCGDCGSLMTRRTLRCSSKTGDKSTYKAWQCKERRNGRKGNGCTMRFVREEELISAIITAISPKTASRQNKSDGKQLEEILPNIDRIEVGQDDVTVVWKEGSSNQQEITSKPDKEASQLAEGF